VHGGTTFAAEIAFAPPLAAKTQASFCNLTRFIKPRSSPLDACGAYRPHGNLPRRSSCVLRTSRRSPPASANADLRWLLLSCSRRPPPPPLRFICRTSPPECNSDTNAVSLVAIAFDTVWQYSSAILSID
jgi:hypothetical protein